MLERSNDSYFLPAVKLEPLGLVYLDLRCFVVEGGNGGFGDALKSKHVRSYYLNVINSIGLKS